MEEELVRKRLWEIKDLCDNFKNAIEEERNLEIFTNTDELVAVILGEDYVEEKEEKNNLEKLVHYTGKALSLVMENS